ncbi:MAG: c-type cytochrome [Daejeonella sp.]|uniref:c-type cytochrome n=1 Tax=Daejeonella sp. JGW-45 TaxID=3034148 RepID=UPI0023EBCD8F|nr:cytochrome c [Daejeonella sp. JGW-45]
MRNRIIYILMTITAGAALFQSCSSEQQLDYQRYFVNGKGIYEKNCQNCHGANGEGLGKLYPPLTDTLSLTKNKPALACIIRNGRNEMPANPALAEIDIAQVIVYITNSFGNKQGFYDQERVKGDMEGCK